VYMHGPRSVTSISLFLASCELHLPRPLYIDIVTDNQPIPM